jgi:hypothetical protein
VSHSAQCERVLQRLRQGPATTLQLINDAWVCCVTRRIFELRQAKHQIETSEKRNGTRRVVTYYLTASHNGDLPTEATTRSYTHIDAKLRCAECNGVIKRKAKARPLKPDESAFCKNSCRDAYHNRRKRIERIEGQQPLFALDERLRSERETIDTFSTGDAQPQIRREGAA